MRIVGMKVENIAGLPDCDLTFPDAGVVAFAGPNGAGKSKLLSCLIAPWLRNLPPSSDVGRNASVQIQMALTESEERALRETSGRLGWPSTSGSNFTYTVIRMTAFGVNTKVFPENPVLQNGLTDASVLSQIPSLDVLYLPAERRLNKTNAMIDLKQLLPEVLVNSLSHSRQTSIDQAGRFEDSEFETFAVALCVASHLPSESGEQDLGAANEWQRFRDAVNGVIAPKILEEVTREHPSELRVRLPTGEKHGIAELSSGERQALTIISRVHRAGTDRTLVIIDEPDVHLHPNLSAALLQAITKNVDSQIFLATHSASILDSLDARSIWSVKHGEQAKPILTEVDRIDLYRSVGFRASELTQAEVLIITEGEFDREILLGLRPDLTRASFRVAGGRKQVIENVRALADYDIPILGVVDGDVLAPEIPVQLQGIIHCWDTADIEAALLSDRNFLSALVEKRLVKDGETVDSLESRLSKIASGLEENTITEMAQRLARAQIKDEFPSPRGDNAEERLRTYLLNIKPLDQGEMDDIFARARQKYSETTEWWKLTRGKYISGSFANSMSPFRDGPSLLHAGVRAVVQPPSTIQVLLKLIDAKLQH